MTNFYNNCKLPLKSIVHFPYVNKRAKNSNCKTKKLLVTKTIRLRDIAWLPENLTSKDSSLKIIYLVRDPRAIAYSRIMNNGKSNKWSWPESEGKIRNICKTFETFLDQRSSNETKSWQNQHLVIRYEDLTTEPIIWAKKIYHFIQMDFSKNIQQIILRKTKLFSTKWAEKLPIEAIKTIEDSCERVFTAFGYRKFELGHDLFENFVDRAGCGYCLW